MLGYHDAAIVVRESKGGNREPSPCWEENAVVNETLDSTPGS